MKIIFVVVYILTFYCGHTQENTNQWAKQIPFTITFFSESVSLPNFRNIFKNPNLGIRIGTELYYSKNESRQLIQTINLGYYYHKDFQNGLYLSSEFGYRKFFNKAFLDATIGAGYLLIHSALPRYERNGNDYERIGNTFGRIMPTIGLGAGYQFDKVSVFSRYEMFGETPFGYKGVPVLPHKALHVGTRFNLK